MLTVETKIRVRYSETDQMGYVYYGNYPQYYEVGRAELMRFLGVSYREMEERGVMCPIADMQIEYKRPGRYDDELTIKTTLLCKPTAKIQYAYEIYNEKGELLNIGRTTLVCVNAETMKPCRAPQWFLDLIEPYF